jgi:hypothetical protein
VINCHLQPLCPQSVLTELCSSEPKKAVAGSFGATDDDEQDAVKRRTESLCPYYEDNSEYEAAGRAVIEKTPGLPKGY